MGKAANTNSPRGFRYEGRFSNNCMPTIKLKTTDAAALLIKNGDPLSFSAGEVEQAVAGSIVVAVAIGTPFVDLVNGDNVILANPALPDVVFRVQDDVASPALSAIGNAYGIDSVTAGAYTIDGKTAGGVDVAIIGIADADDMYMYNEGDEQYRDVLVIFQRTLWNGMAKSSAVQSLVFEVTATAAVALPIPGLKEGDEIVGASVICTAANASGTLVLEDGAGDDIGVMICAVDKVVVTIASIDDAKSTLPSTGAAIISVGGTAADTRGIVKIDYIPA